MHFNLLDKLRDISAITAEKILPVDSNIRDIIPAISYLSLNKVQIFFKEARAYPQRGGDKRALTLIGKSRASRRQSLQGRRKPSVKGRVEIATLLDISKNQK